MVQDERDWLQFVCNSLGQQPELEDLLQRDLHLSRGDVDIHLLFRREARLLQELGVSEEDAGGVEDGLLLQPACRSQLGQLGERGREVVLEDLQILELEHVKLVEALVVDGSVVLVLDPLRMFSDDRRDRDVEEEGAPGGNGVVGHELLAELLLDLLLDLGLLWQFLLAGACRQPCSRIWRRLAWACGGTPEGDLTLVAPRRALWRQQ